MRLPLAFAHGQHMGDGPTFRMCSPTYRAPSLQDAHPPIVRLVSRSHELPVVFLLLPPQIASELGPYRADTVHHRAITGAERTDARSAKASMRNPTTRARCMILM